MAYDKYSISVYLITKVLCSLRGAMSNVLVKIISILKYKMQNL